MSLFAWTQDVPINAEIYAKIVARIGDQTMPGLVVHLAIEKPDGTLRYIDVWESEADCDAAFEQVVHPAVHPELVANNVVVTEEPPRTPINVIDISFGERSAVQA
jgi:hypothetical protein